VVVRYGKTAGISSAASGVEGSEKSQIDAGQTLLENADFLVTGCDFGLVTSSWAFSTFGIEPSRCPMFTKFCIYTGLLSAATVQLIWVFRCSETNYTAQNVPIKSRHIYDT